MADVRGDGADIAVQRDFEAAAERRAVDRGEGRERKLAQPAEQLVPRLPSFAGALGRDPGELRDVGSYREDQRLAGQDEPAPVARAEAAEYLREGFQRVGAEGVRLAPVRAVVDRDECDRADACR